MIDENVADSFLEDFRELIHKYPGIWKSASIRFFTVEQLS